VGPYASNPQGALVRVEPGESIAVGDVTPGSTWAGAVYVRWRRLGPPATLTVELRGRRADHRTKGGVAAEAVAGTGTGAGAGTGMETGNVSEVQTALEITAEISVQAPFAVSHEVTADYRLHALHVDGTQPESMSRIAGAGAGAAEGTSLSSSLPLSLARAGDGARLLSTIRVSAASSRLNVASVSARDADTGADAGTASASDGGGGAVLSEGDEFLHVSAAEFIGGDGGTASRELDVTWQRQAETPGESHPGEDVHTMLRLPMPLGAPTPRAPPPLTVTLHSPPHIAAGHSFTWNVRCANATSLPQPLTVQVADANGGAGN